MGDPKAQMPESVAQLPHTPGVYLMKDAEGTVLYVGKATDLHKRVRSYFSRGRDVKTRALVAKIDDVDFVVTRNPYEALILENNLIKKHTPKYNINLKDGKTYPVIRLTNEAYPRVFKTRRIIQDGSQYFGPFPNVGAIDRYIELIFGLYPLRRCRGPVKPRATPCLYFHIGRCAGVCAGRISQEHYALRVDEVRKLLSGDTAAVIEQLQGAMATAAESRLYERAARLRDGIAAIDTLAAEQQVTDFDDDARDYVGSGEHEGVRSFVVFQMRAGKLVGSDTFRTTSLAESDDDLTQFLVQYYSQLRKPPLRIFIGSNTDHTPVLRFFREQLGSPVTLAMPELQRDLSILRMADETARQDAVVRARQIGNRGAVEALQEILRLDKPPLRIEGFDIAHLAGKHTVAALVVFKNGVPDRGQYRTFKIKSLQGKIDDFESIREAVSRRYSRVLNEKQPRPDLILIDGGLGQVNAARTILAALDLGSIPLLGLAKRAEELFLPDQSQPMRLPIGSPALKLLQFVRDEAHRFGTTMNQRLRAKDIRLSTLEAIEGIGPRRAQRIMAEFGELDAVAEAEPAYLAEKTGISQTQAAQVITALRRPAATPQPADSVE